MRTIIEKMQVCYIHFYQKIARKKVPRVNAAVCILGQRKGVRKTKSSQNCETATFYVGRWLFGWSLNSNI